MWNIDYTPSMQTDCRQQWLLRQAPEVGMGSRARLGPSAEPQSIIEGPGRSHLGRLIARKLTTYWVWTNPSAGSGGGTPLVSQAVLVQDRGGELCHVFLSRAACG